MKNGDVFGFDRNDTEIYIACTASRCPPSDPSSVFLSANEENTVAQLKAMFARANDASYAMAA